MNISLYQYAFFARHSGAAYWFQRDIADIPGSGLISVRHLFGASVWQLN